MQKTVSEEEAKTGKPLELTDDQWTIRYQKAIQDYAKDVRKSVVRELKRRLATGSISLTDNKAKDGDRPTLTAESLPPDGSTAGISAVFEIAIKKHGAKIQWSPSLLFVRRLGLKDSEVNPPAGSTTAPLNRVNFAPSPGVTFGLAYFKPHPLSEFEEVVETRTIDVYVLRRGGKRVCYLGRSDYDLRARIRQSGQLDSFCLSGCFS